MCLSERERERGNGFLNELFNGNNGKRYPANNAKQENVFMWLHEIKCTDVIHTLYTPDVYRKQNSIHKTSSFLTLP